MVCFKNYMLLCPHIYISILVMDGGVVLERSLIGSFHIIFIFFHDPFNCRLLILDDLEALSTFTLKI